MLDQLDVKSKVQLAKFSFWNFDKIMKLNLQKMSVLKLIKTTLQLELKQLVLTKVSLISLFHLLLKILQGYYILGKGDVGDAQMAWYKKNLLNPFARAMENVSRDREFFR